jgi:hypothetical protein
MPGSQVNGRLGKPCASSPTIESVPQTFPNLPVPAASARCAPAATRRYDAPLPLRLWHLFSLDAPTVAVAWSFAFAWAAGVRLPIWIPVLLALSAWAVYIADRVLDARAAFLTGNPNGLRERHRFHYRHRRLLVPLAIAAAFAAAWIVFTMMPTAARVRNSALALAALAYFTRVHSPSRLFGLGRSPFLKKELLVGLQFTAACALPALSRAAAQSSPAFWPVSAAAIVLALLAWLNCYAIDRWEFTEQRPRKSQIEFPACLLALSGLLIACFLAAIQPDSAVLALAGAVSALLLALLDRLRSRLTPLALRAAADLVLLTPLALILK